MALFNLYIPIQILFLMGGLFALLLFHLVALNYVKKHSDKYLFLLDLNLKNSGLSYGLSRYPSMKFTAIVTTQQDYSAFNFDKFLKDKVIEEADLFADITTLLTAKLEQFSNYSQTAFPVLSLPTPKTAITRAISHPLYLFYEEALIKKLQLRKKDFTVTITKSLCYPGGRPILEDQIVYQFDDVLFFYEKFGVNHLVTNTD
ncbi:MAG: hypothetical protein R3Y07_02020 [Eubacteriales bacterium]